MRPPSVGESSEVDEFGSKDALYVKPDDRWEFNEAFDRRPEIAAALGERLDALLQQAAAGALLELPPLPAELIKGG